MRKITLSSDEFFRDLLTKARAQGIARPVFASLPSGSPPALAVLADVKAEAAPATGPEGEELAVMEVLSIPDARRVLRRHCGVGGVVTAALLEQQHEQDWWLLALTKEEVLASPFKNGEGLWTCVHGYDELGHDAMSTMDSIMRPYVAAALAGGVSNPVLLLLATNSPQAAAIHAAVASESPQSAAGASGPQGHDDSRIVVLPTPEACRLLRLHCGPGGGAVVELLEDRVLQQEYWALALGKDAIEAAAVADGASLCYYQLPYTSAPRRLNTPSRMGEEGPAAIPLRLDSGEVVQVYGRSGEAALVAARLIFMITSRRMDTEVDRREVSIPLTDSRLALLLERVGREAPYVIAEVITTLRKTKGRQDRWLRRVLWGRKDLRQLARLVEVELKGEE